MLMSSLWALVEFVGQCVSLQGERQGPGMTLNSQYLQVCSVERKALLASSGLEAKPWEEAWGGGISVFSMLTFT